MEVSQDNIKLARFLAGAIGFEPNVYPYYDDGESHQIDILSLKDPIDELVGIYSSIGLSDYENLVAVSDGKNNIPIELMVTAYTRFESATNILSTCCFYIMKDKFECRPGAVLCVWWNSTSKIIWIPSMWPFYFVSLYLIGNFSINLNTEMMLWNPSFRIMRLIYMICIGILLYN